MASAAILISAMKKNVLSIAIEIPRSATLRAFFLKTFDSSFKSPYNLTRRAPETLKRSVIVEDISPLISKESRVYPCKRAPIHLVGAKKTGSSRSEATVICQLSANIVPTTRIRVSTLLISPEKVEVKARCAPITSELIRVIKAPV